MIVEELHALDQAIAESKENGGVDVQLNARRNPDATPTAAAQHGAVAESLDMRRLISSPP